MVVTTGQECHTSISWVEARDVVKLLQSSAPPTTNYPVQNVNSAEVEKPLQLVMLYLLYRSLHKTLWGSESFPLYA